MTRNQGIGYVVASSAGKAKVKIPRTSSCQTCAHKGSCCDPFGSDFMLVEALNPHGALTGQRVSIELPPVKALKAYGFLYLIPLAGLLLGAVFGYNVPIFGEAEASAAIFSLLFLIASFGLLYALNRLFWAQDSAMQAKIVSILPSHNSGLPSDRTRSNGSSSRPHPGGCAHCS